MKKRAFTPAVCILVLAGTGNGISAEGRAIGMVAANGNFQLDLARVTGTGTLFEGSRIETLSAVSHLRLNDGAQFLMAAGGRAEIYERQLVLQAGSGQLEGTPGYEVEARSVRIRAEQAGTIARIALSGNRQVTVAALRGAVRVTNSSGLLVAKVEAGSSLDFESRATGGITSTQATGCLIPQAGKFVLAEQTTNILLELRGAGLNQESGNRVQVTGTLLQGSLTVKGVAQVIAVAKLERIGKGGCAGVAEKVAAAAVATGAGAGVVGAATADASAGVSAGTIAVIGGIAAAATVGGLAAVGSLPGQSDVPPSASR